MLLLTSRAIRDGKGVDGLKKLREKTPPAKWREETTATAASVGDLASLTYAHVNGCPWKENTSIHAAEKGNLACLKYAIQNGCPATYHTMGAALTNIDCFVWLLSEENVHRIQMMTPSIWKHANSTMLSLLLECCSENNFRKKWDGSVMADAVIKRSQDPGRLELCITNDAPVDVKTIEELIRNGTTLDIQFLYEAIPNGLSRITPFLRDRMSTVIERADIDLLRYVHEELNIPLPRLFKSFNCTTGTVEANLQCFKYILQKDVRISYHCLRQLIHEDMKDPNATALRSIFEGLVGKAHILDQRSFADRCLDQIQWEMYGGTRFDSPRHRDHFFRTATNLVHLYCLLWYLQYEPLTLGALMRQNLDLVRAIAAAGETPCPLTHSQRLEILRHNSILLLDMAAEFFPVSEFTRDEWDCIPRELRSLLVRRYVYPRALNVARWMLKVRPYAWFWYEHVQMIQCGPYGVGRKRDREAFEGDFEGNDGIGV